MLTIARLVYGTAAAIGLAMPLVQFIGALFAGCRIELGHPTVTRTDRPLPGCEHVVVVPDLIATIACALLIREAALWTASQHRAKPAVAAVGIVVGLLLSAYGLGSLAFIGYFGPSPLLVVVAGASVIGVPAALVFTREWYGSGSNASGRAEDLV